MSDHKPGDVYKDTNGHLWKVREDGVKVDCQDEPHLLSRTFDQLQNVYDPLVRVHAEQEWVDLGVVEEEKLADWERELLEESQNDLRMLNKLVEQATAEIDEATDHFSIPIKVTAGTKDDPVNHPAHYTQYPVEVIELTEWMPYNRGCAVKYLSRAGFKDQATEIQDLEKAQWYVAREIERVRRMKEAA